MEVKEFIAKLNRSNFSLSVDNGKLNLTGDKMRLSKEEIESIRSNKEVIDYIKANKNELIEFITLAGDGATLKKGGNIASIYRLSGLQQGMLFHGLYEETEAHKVYFTCQLTGLDERAFAGSWKQLLQHHTILRTAFFYDAFNVPVQCVYQEVQLPITLLDYRHLPEPEKQAAIQDYEAADRKKSFDFKTPPLMRIALLRLTDELYQMHWTSHHILFDGWSLPVLMEEFLTTYELLLTGTALTAAPEDKYEDYIRYLDRIDKAKEETYWRNYLAGITQSTLLPFIEHTAERTKGAGESGTVSLQIDATATGNIQAFAQSHRLTLNTLMQGVWALLLHRYTGSRNIVYGTIVSGRPDDLPGVEKRVGMYINTLPLHSILEEEADIVSFLTTLQNGQVASRQYQYTPLSDAQKWAGISGDWFDSLLVFENYPVSKITASGHWQLKVTNVSIHDPANYPLVIVISSSGQIEIRFNYHTQLLAEEYVHHIRDHFKNILTQITEGATTRLSNLSLLSPAEQQLLTGVNAPETAYPENETIVSLFEQQAARTPEATALIFEEETLTYRHLNERSNQLARHLRSKGVRAEILVPICIERGSDMITGILGILKAGGAYVPIDPEYPFDRIRYVLEDTGATIMVSSSLSRLKLASLPNIAIIEVDGERAAIGQEPAGNLPVTVSPNHLAYIIYTSGSTGQPKGVMIQHNNVTRLFKTEQPLYNFDEQDVWCLFHSFCFDFSVWEMFGALFFGGRLVIIPQQATKDMALFAAILHQQKVTVLNHTPSAFYVLQDYLSGEPALLPPVRYLIFGGEALNPFKLQPWHQWYGDGCRMVNMYGITETTVHVTYQPIGLPQLQSSRSIIGKPIPTLSVYIVDSSQQLVPAGIPGELWVGGAGVARGYLNRPELTAERFIPDPFSQKAGARVYRTGDLGRWLPDGTIEYLGRIDNQVKVRAYRIELGEIESVLEQHEAVSQAAVAAMEDAENGNRLVAYVVSKGPMDKEALLTYLKEKLPAYMVPATWVPMEKMPLTTNGKIDRKALPEAEPQAAADVAYIAPRNETEQKLAAIFSEFLGRERVGIHDHFFETGGHSLLAMRTISLIRRQLQAEVSIKDLFTHPTIAALAEHLSRQTGQPVVPAITVQPRPALIPLSFSQERLWFVDQLEGSTQYHIPAVLRLKGYLQIELLEAAFRTIINRHEVLRTVIKQQDGTGYQVVQSAAGWQLQILEDAAYRNEATLPGLINDLIKKPFNLSADYMLRAAVVPLTDQAYMLVATMHHIASDGWSISVLVKEIVELYEAALQNRPARLVPLPIQYADYAIWQRAYLQGAVWEQKLAYWKSKLEGVATLQLPTDFTRPAVQEVQGAATSFSIDSAFTQQINNLSRQQGVTLFMTLLTAFKTLLYRYTGQADICIGTPIANRTQQEVENLIGFFVNTLALRSPVSGGFTFTQLLQSVKTTTLEAYTHQEVPFEKVMDAVVKQRDMSRSPLVQVMFILQNTPAVPQLRFGDLALTSEPGATTSSKFDITFSLTETPGGLQGSILYSTALYQPETIARLAGHYTQLLQSIVAAPDQSIARLPMLSAAEEHTLLSRFNDTQVAWPADENIVTLLQTPAVKTPEAVALQWGKQRLTYQQLHQRSNQLAHYLRAKGVAENVLVPICAEKGFEMIIGIIGILKAGGAYVPVDPAYPTERIRFMLADTAAPIMLVAGTNIAESITMGNQVEVINLNTQWTEMEAYPDLLPEVRIQPHHLAYVLYTSGSTGRPKGVQVPHSAFANHLLWFNQQYGITEDDRSLLLSSFSFDGSMTSLWPVLLQGGTLHLPEQNSLDADAVLHYIKTNGITYLKTLPGVLKAIVQRGAAYAPVSASVRLVIVGGEKINVATFKQYRQQYPHIVFANHYGPTECTISSSYYVVDAHNTDVYTTQSIIGKPVSNTRIYVLGDEASLCPTGVIGEIAIGGTCVASGYLNRPELTDERFIPDPYSRVPGATLYKTGDIGRWLPDGNLEYIGRKDSQVKVRGYRIELSEIEAVLQQSGLVSNVAVVAREDAAGDARLIGYVIAGPQFSRAAIIGCLKSQLPDYMVPLVWVNLEQFPLSPNGKTDKTAFPEPEAASAIASSEAQTATEIQLTTIWQTLLRKEAIGLQDNFFEAGGHSLLAMQVISLIRKELEVEIAIRDLFVYPTIAGLAAHIDAQNGGALLPKIEVQPRPAYIPLSFSQERMWFVHQLNGSIAFHLPTVLKLTGKLHIAALHHALQQVVNRHQILRTVILEKDGRGYQLVLPENALPLPVTDGAAWVNNAAGLQAYIQQSVNVPFNLGTDHLLRTELVQLSDQEHVLISVMHHIASDKWSTPIFIQEVVESYESYVQQRTPVLAPLHLQYADYAIWQRAYLQGELLQQKLHYWKEKLSGTGPLELPTDYTRPAVQSGKGAIKTYRLDGELSAALKTLSYRQQSTLFMTLLAAFKVLLYRYTGQADICVGTSIAGRQQHEIENLIGLFVNILALRTQVAEDETFTHLLQQVKQTTLEAYQHQEVPFEKVVDAVAGERDRSRSPIFQVMLVMLNTPEASTVAVEGLTLSGLGYAYAASKYDLTFFATESPEGLTLSVEYSTDLFGEPTIDRMVAHFEVLLQSIIANPDRQVARLPMVSPAEQQLLMAVNQTAATYPAQASIISLFEQQVQQRGTATALLFEDDRLSYTELNSQANRLAHLLKAHGVGQETLVPICLEKGVDMMVSILAVLKAGGAYVPVDPQYPQQRIHFMLQDVGATVVITNTKYSNQVAGAQGIHIIYLDSSRAAVAAQPDGNLDTPVLPHHLAYVIYTSGSTGQPKGVLATHSNVVSLVTGVQYVSLSPENVLLSTGAPTFDATTFEYWGMLLNGGQLVLCPENTLLDTTLLQTEIADYAVNMMWFTASWFNQLVETSITVFETLKTVLVGGEKLSEKHISKFRQQYPAIQLINGYGPTENTTFSLTYPITETKFETAIPIGKPLSNRTAYVLDQQQQLCPVGMAGEIFVGGAGVTMGYLNQPELTAARFIPDLFSSKKDSRLYRTGDRGRYLPNGNLEYMGRIDQQVKIRGYRIEPGEIEAVLQELPLVQQAVVTVKINAEGTKRLIAYLVPAEDFDKDAVRRHLQDNLPDYMLPSVLVEIEALPLTPNGKIDRKALPDPDENKEATGEFLAPRNHTEQVLASIWQTLLDVEQISINDNFFERGGDSLLAIRVISAIRKELDVEVAISSLFEHQTIAGLAAHLQAATQTAVLPAIVPAPRPAHIPLSFSQQRLWFIDRLEGSIQYHITTALRLRGQLNLPALQHAFNSIINRHEVLRTVFRDENGEAWQTVKEATNWDLPVTDGTVWQQDVQGLQQSVQQLIHEPFDLSKDNMLRAHLITLSAAESLLIITLHHIASDGWSASILVREIGEYYAAFEQGRPPVLPLLPIQYADFAIWQQNYLAGPVLDEKLDYWVHQLQGVTPIQLPTDFVRPAIQTIRGSSSLFSFDEQTTTALQQLSQQQGSTLFMTLLTALKVLLYRYTGSQDICIGTATAGRQQQEVEGLIGFFINTLALRSALQADDTFTHLLSQVKRTTLEAYEHQDVPFEKVVDAVTTKRDRSRNPIIQVMFVLQNTPDIPRLQFGNVQFVSEPYEHTTAQFELSFSMIEQAGGLSGSVVYNADLYAPETIDRLLIHFQQLVRSILQQPDRQISRLNFLPEAEQRQLKAFNNTTAVFPPNKTVVDLIAEQVAAAPQQLALIDGQGEMTYSELHHRSNQLARFLELKGMGAGKLVPVCMDRSTELVVSLLAILKTGAAYVPIDPAYPAERISYMLQDIDTAVLLSNTSGLAAIGDIQNIEVIQVDTGWPTIADQPSGNLHIKPAVSDLAYVIFTSGSTGRPKGVMIEHAGLANLIYWHHGAYGVTAAGKATAMAGVGFDAFGWEIWPYLTAGASVHLISNEQRLAATQLLQVFSENSITHSFVPTALVPELIEATRHKPLSLQYLLTGGDKLNLVNTEGIGYALINNYGPTENTVVATCYPVGQKDKTYPIGKPVANTRIYIIDPQKNLTGIGIPGEICISGASLSRGYLHQPQLTAEKFIDNPFEQNGSRLYKTGDIGRWLPDGNIEYGGRMDEQVKILGNRIELGEIETVLQQSGLVQQSVVLVKEAANGSRQLIAYVVADPFNREAVLAHLKTMLPAYMVPTVWVPLQSLPLTANGKIDKQLLPDADAGASVSDNYVAPRNATEAALAQIWQDLLHIERAGVEDNFFELGGHSLLVMRLIAAINQQMGVELSVKDVFEFSTISELSKYLEVQRSLAPEENDTDDFDLLVI